MVNEGYEGGIGVRQQSIVRLLEIYCLAGNDRGGGYQGNITDPHGEIR